MTAIDRIGTRPERPPQGALKPTHRQNVRPACSGEEIADRLPTDPAGSGERPHGKFRPAGQRIGQTPSDRLHDGSGRLPGHPGVRPLIRIDGVVPWRRGTRPASGHEDASLKVVIDTDTSGRLTGRWSWTLSLEAAVSERLLAYEPKPETVPAEQWRRIAPVVRSLGFVAVAVGPYTPGVIMTPLARLTAWAEQQGLPMEPAVLLDQSTTERFILTGCRDMKSATRRTMSSQLRRATEALLLDQLGQRPPVRLTATVTPMAPYSPREIARWLIWAQSMPTPAQRRNACLMVCLGIGCGLAVEDLAHVRGGDINEGPTGRVLVQVTGGRRPRRVVCRYAYEELLLDEALRIDSDEYVFRPEVRDRTSKHLSSDWLAKYPMATGRNTCEVLQPQRLRTAWIVTLIELGIPLTVILQAAGLSTLHSLSRYLVFLRDVSQETALNLLRGALA